MAFETFCHLIEGWDTDNCCSSCHEDAYYFDYEPCSVIVEGKEVFICCTCMEWWNEKHEGD